METLDLNQYLWKWQRDEFTLQNAKPDAALEHVCLYTHCVCLHCHSCD